MREIKFRFWHRDLKKMFYNVILDNGEVKNSGRWVLWGSYERVMQFTGLKDKNGKEIYEGDILTIHPNSDDYIDVEVIFYKGCFCYKTKEGGIFAFYSENGWAGITKLREVIGNIYQNKNLLKE